MNKIAFGVLIVSLALGFAVVADDGDKKSGLIETLQKNMPGSQFKSVKETPIKGLYEAVNASNGSIVYATLDGDYLISGYLYDRKSGENLTTMAIMSAVQDDQTVVFAPKNKKVDHTLTIFTDTNCGYCRKLHQEIPTLNSAGVKVRYMMLPRAGLGSPSYKTLQSVWCADNQQNAMNLAKVGSPIPEKTCDNPIEAHLSVATALGVSGTPYMVTDKGDVINGWRPANALLSQLNANN